MSRLVWSEHQDAEYRTEGPEALKFQALTYRCVTATLKPSVSFPSTLTAGARCNLARRFSTQFILVEAYFHFPFVKPFEQLLKSKSNSRSTTCLHRSAEEPSERSD